MRPMNVNKVLIGICFSGVWFARRSPICLWHLHHLPTNQNDQAAHSSFYWWEQHACISLTDPLHATSVCDCYFIIMFLFYRWQSLNTPPPRTAVKNAAGVLKREDSGSARMMDSKMSRSQFNVCNCMMWTNKMYFSDRSWEEHDITKVSGTPHICLRVCCTRDSSSKSLFQPQCTTNKKGKTVNSWCRKNLVDAIKHLV